MIKFFDNIIFSLQRSGGGSVYWGELIKRFNGDESVFIEPNKNTENIIRTTLKLAPIIHEKQIPLSILRYLPVTAKLAGKSIFHSSYYRYSSQKEVKTVVTVHDFIFERFQKGIRKVVHEKQKGACIHRASGIICISENTKKDLLHFYPSIDKRKIRVIYNGVSEDFFPLEKNELKQRNNLSYYHDFKVVLFIGHRTVYKNFPFAVDVVASLPADYKLVIVGNRLTEEETNFLNRRLNNRYQFVGNVSNAELNIIYNASSCLIYPSSYEGFGIPLLEAFKTGCPVVTLNSSSIPEVAGDAGLLAKDLILSDFTSKIRSLENEKLRAEVILKGFNQSEKFSWSKCYDEVKDFYEFIYK